MRQRAARQSSASRGRPRSSGTVAAAGTITSRAQAPPRGLQVIGGGFARTGTKSTEAALIRLGHKIYDTRSILECNHADRCVKAAQELRDGKYDEVRDLLEEMEQRGYTATLDFPVNLFVISSSMKCHLSG